MRGLQVTLSIWIVKSSILNLLGSEVTVDLVVSGRKLKFPLQRFSLQQQKKKPFPLCVFSPKHNESSQFAFCCQHPARCTPPLLKESFIHIV